MTDATPDLPMTFDAFPLSPALRQGLDALGYETPTPVQAQALPAILTGRDVLAQAPTGSGKTAAFGLGLLHGLDVTRGDTQALVLCPTRELADQVARNLRKLATGVANLKVSLLVGGVALAPQLASLEQHAPHVVVGTPGRVLELVEKRALTLDTVRVLVLDEADRMLDMGFEEAIRALVKRTPKTRQTLLFSATFADAVRDVAGAMLREPLEVHVQADVQAPRVEEIFVEAEASRRTPLLAALLLEHRPESCVVFCNMRREVDDVASSLQHYGFAALALHGDMDQRDREEVLVQFSNRSCSVLVASDVAARGLDVEDLAAVVNHALPSDTDTYVHRIGRTARAGKGGLAISLVAANERGRLEQLQARRAEHGDARSLQWRAVAPVGGRPSGVPVAKMATLRIDAGRTDKLRPGDIVGALVNEAGLAGDAIGKIDVFPTRSYVAVPRRQVDRVLEKLRAGKIKGRRFRVAKL